MTTTVRSGAPTAARRAWVLKAGSVRSMRLKEKCQLPRPGFGEVLVQVKAIGLNFADVFSVLGLYSATPSGEFTPGLKFSGVVGAIGTDPGLETSVEFASVEARRRAEKVAGNFRVGDRVSGVMRFGAYSTEVLAPAHQLRKIPAEWTFEQGAAFNVQALTSYYGLKALGDVKPGQTVLVHSAAGGCGLLALGILKAIGAKAVGTVGTKTKVDVILNRFPDYIKREQIIVRDRKRFPAQLRESLDFLESEGFDVVLDAVGGDFFRPGFDSLSPGGRHIIYGAADLTPQADRVWSIFNPLVGLRLAYKYLTRPKVDPLQLPADNKSVMGFSLIWMFSHVNVLLDLLEALYAMDLDPPLVGQVFDFEDAPKAIRLFQSGVTTGKVVLKIDHE